MRNSFQDQMLKLGLVDEKKAKKAKNEKHIAKKIKVGKGKPQKLSVVEENALLVKKAAEKKKAKDRQLNQKRDAKLQKRAEFAQIKQLIDQHKLSGDDNGHAYRFNVSGKIHRIFVDAKMAGQLGSGFLGIVEIPGAVEQFAVVPAGIVAKIRGLNAQVFTALVEGASTADTQDEDDPYAAYKVPDDLMW